MILRCSIAASVAQCDCPNPLSYTVTLGRIALETAIMETRIKPHSEQAAEEARRAEQRRLYRRNQALGLVILAAAILTWWLFHTNSKWIFPPGWWRW